MQGAILYLCLEGYAELRRSVRKPLDMCLPPPTEIGDMASGDPDRVPDAARALRESFEIGVQHTTFLCAQDGRAHCIAVEGL